MDRHAVGLMFGGWGAGRALGAIPPIIVQMGWGDQTLLRARIP